jgi:hypothetical protein
LQVEDARHRERREDQGRDGREQGLRESTSGDRPPALVLQDKRELSPAWRLRVIRGASVAGGVGL